MLLFSKYWSTCQHRNIGLALDKIPNPDLINGNTSPKLYFQYTVMEILPGASIDEQFPFAFLNSVLTLGNLRQCISGKITIMTSVPDPQAVNSMLLTKRFHFPHLISTQHSSSIMSSGLHFERKEKAKQKLESLPRQGSRELEAPALHYELNQLWSCHWQSVWPAKHTWLAKGLELLEPVFSREERLHCITHPKPVTFGTHWILQQNLCLCCLALLDLCYKMWIQEH